MSEPMVVVLDPGRAVSCVNYQWQSCGKRVANAWQMRGRRVAVVWRWGATQIAPGLRPMYVRDVDHDFSLQCIYIKHAYL